MRLIAEVTKCENYTDLQYSTAKGIVIFQYSLHLRQQSSSTFDEARVFPPGQSCSPSSVALPPLHTVSHSASSFGPFR
jgi:hypothetical protein